MSFVLDKRLILPLVLLILGVFGGIKLHAHLRLNHMVLRQTETRQRVQDTNELLKSEKKELEQMLDGINNKGDIPGLNEATLFSDKASQIYEHLHERTELLTAKEELLWEKELQIEEVKVLMSARSGIETEMAQYINMMAHQMLSLNMSLPADLSRKPYVSVSNILRDNEPSPQFNFMMNYARRRKDAMSSMTSSRENELAAEGASFLHGDKAEEGIALLFHHDPPLPTPM